MVVLPGNERGMWTVMWEVPLDQEEEPLRLTLIAEDGHSSPEWISDGGRTEQRYWLTVKDSNSIDLEELGLLGGTEDLDIGGVSGEPSGDGIGEDSFGGSGYVATNCDQAPSSGHLPSAFLMLLFGLLISRHRKTDRSMKNA
jgi:hypothetical protein